MAFCSYCGNKVPDDAKFCKTCGKRLDGSIPARESVQVRFTERKQEYAGTIVKCPSCGEIMPSFTAICPSCGHEINAAKVSTTIADFSEQIRRLDEAIALNPSKREENGWRTWDFVKKVGWVFLNFMLSFIPLVIYWIKQMKISRAFTPEENRKAAFINSYNFPNDRESIMEALLYIETQVSQQTLSSDTAGAHKWAGIWKSKAEQLYQRAEAMFPGDPLVKNSYESILAAEKKVKMPIQLWSYFKLAIAVLLGLFILITFVKSAIKALNNYDDVIRTSNSENTQSSNTFEKTTRIELGDDSFAEIALCNIVIKAK